MHRAVTYSVVGSTKGNISQQLETGPDGAVAMSSPNGMVGNGFSSRYRLQPRAGF